MIATEPLGEAVPNGHHPDAPTEINARDLFSLHRRTIIVTGASGGMGLTVVKAILQSGADVIAMDRHEAASSAHKDLQRVAQENNVLLTYQQCDISNLESTSSGFETAVSRARYPLRGLVHCAAIGWTGPSISFPIDEAKQIVEVNLIGTLICAQAAATLVQRQKNGGLSASFVLIASMSGYVVNKGTPNAAYAASKAGVHQLTRNLASEWGCPQSSRNGGGGGGGGGCPPPIRVNSISPGVIRTPMTADVLAGTDNERIWTEESMLKRLSEPEDYRGPVIFLLSEASAYVTGADLLVDGGYTAW
ncbi:D-arabinitol 2-dehydrogenase [ribulose-forming] [Cladophialophora carrionii]|uniref:D-arabinitol 2-dehydrogenase [ribulose-forming] n=1 Tax=Cladophialophora carrionii TaxID=86049 RepID=A0A1C1C7T0_9EURO|nr:D-arabinitol 2-dehydrogenase [ribulose-forming] [Cladophialophora carrionii]